MQEVRGHDGAIVFLAAAGVTKHMPLIRLSAVTWGLRYCPYKLKACSLKLPPLSPSSAVCLPANPSPGGDQGHQVAGKVERLSVLRLLK